jgi:hypothetical protein
LAKEHIIIDKEANFMNAYFTFMTQQIEWMDSFISTKTSYDDLNDNTDRKMGILNKVFL